ncbi:MAG: hypothetical protein ACK40G_01685 [Cytophagaceae bacterium]
MDTVETLDQVTSKIKNMDRTESKVAAFIEAQTSKLPSDLFLWASLGSMAASLTLKILKQDSMSLFVGQWAPSFLLFGIYNKMVKLEGHDYKSK